MFKKYHPVMCWGSWRACSGGMLASDWLSLSPMSHNGLMFWFWLMLLVMLVVDLDDVIVVGARRYNFLRCGKRFCRLSFANRAYLQDLKHLFFVLKGRMWWVKVAILLENLLESRQKTGDFAKPIFFCGQKDCLYYL